MVQIHPTGARSCGIKLPTINAFTTTTQRPMPHPQGWWTTKTRAWIRYIRPPSSPCSAAFSEYHMCLPSHILSSVALSTSRNEMTLLNASAHHGNRHADIYTPGGAMECGDQPSTARKARAQHHLECVVSHYCTSQNINVSCRIPVTLLFDTKAFFHALVDRI